MKTKTIILALILILTHCVFAGDIEVTKKSALTVEAVKTVVVRETLDIDNLVREEARIMAQRDKELSDRAAELKTVRELIAKAKLALVEPSVAVAAIVASNEVKKAETADLDAKGEAVPK